MSVTFLLSWKITLTFLCYSATSVSAQPKRPSSDYWDLVSNAKLKVVDKGINYITELVDTVLNGMLHHNDFSDNFQMEFERGSINLNSCYVTNHTLPGLKVNLEAPNLIKLYKTNGSITFSGSFDSRAYSRFQMASTNFRCLMSSVNQTMSLEFFAKNSHIYAILSQCAFDGKVDVNFLPPRWTTVQFLHKNKARFEKLIKSHLSRVFCANVKKMLSRINEKISTIKTRRQLFTLGSSMARKMTATMSNLLPAKAVKSYMKLLSNIEINYGLLINPEVFQHSMTLYVGGQVFWKANDTLAVPFQSETPAEVGWARFYDKMLYLTVSDHLLNTLLYYIHENSDFDVKLNAKEAPKMAALLRFVCDTDEGQICIGLLFPELADQFYDHSLEIIFSRAPKRPRVVIKPGLIKIHWHTIVSLIAIRRSKPKHLLKIKVSTEADLKLKINSSESVVLVGSCEFKDFQCHLMESSVEAINQNAVNGLALVASPILQSMLNNVLERGIPLPGVIEDILMLTSVNFLLLDRKFRVETDFKLQPDFLAKAALELLASSAEEN